MLGDFRDASDRFHAEMHLFHPRSQAIEKERVFSTPGRLLQERMCGRSARRAWETPATGRGQASAGAGLSRTSKVFMTSSRESR